MISFDPLIPVWLLLTALAGVCFVIYRTVGRKRLRLVCWLVAALRDDRRPGGHGAAA